jgi:ATP-dependent DNA helicase RecQ
MFRWFMKHREDGQELPQDLCELLIERAGELASGREIAGVVAVPSRRWAGREAVTRVIAEGLGVPALTSALAWREAPEHTQAELANNDQRRKNVDGKLGVGGPLPRGDLLVLDDVIGSGATLREAGRALRKEGRAGGALIPIVVARVRRRLGASGSGP